MTTSAKIIADSISEHGIRITTMELCYPLIVHAELMTHRMFSRNAASNRAIPTHRIIEQVESGAFYPTHWGKNQPGMQADDKLTGDDLREAHDIWTESVTNSVKSAQKLNVTGLHKQIANRVLMPYQYIKVIVTATEWDNFFNLRLHPDAQPEMQELSRCMKEAMYMSIPTRLRRGEWHIPYIPTDIQENGLWDFLESDCPTFNYEKAIKCSVARCARVSYMNHNNSPDVEKDIALADRLLEAGHMSPFEHQATPMDFAKDTYELTWEKGVTHRDRKDNLWSANFRGWIQYRQLI